MATQFIKTNLSLFFTFIILLNFAGYSFAAAVDRFSPVLQDFGSSGNGFPTVYTTLVQPDGKILVGGKFTVANGAARSGIARFNADYTLDATFNAGDFSVDENILYASSGGSINVIKLQADGKILIGGSFRRDNQPNIQAVARLNADGSIDPTFQSQIVGASIGDLEIQTDGRIVVGGYFQIAAINPQTGQSVMFKNLARLNADGSFDFGFTGNALQYSDNIVIQPDGKILLGGQFTRIDDQSRIGAARLNDAKR